MTTTAAAVVVLALALLTNVWVHVGARRTHVVTGPLVAVLLGAVGRAAGLSWDDLGLSMSAVPSGLLLGTVAAVLVVGGQVLAARRPSVRRMFLDERYRMPVREARGVALVRVPLATVLPEEVLFRSVLWGLLERERGALAATVLSAVLFGLWHVLPGLDLLRTNAATTGRGGAVLSRAVLSIAGTVLFTTVAGLLFAELRRRSGSVVAPVCLHWATNACAVLLAARAWAAQSEAAAAACAENS